MVRNYRIRALGFRLGLGLWIGFRARIKVRVRIILHAQAHLYLGYTIFSFSQTSWVTLSQEVYDPECNNKAPLEIFASL